MGSLRELGHCWTWSVHAKSSQDQHLQRQVQHASAYADHDYTSKQLVELSCAYRCYETEQWLYRYVQSNQVSNMKSSDLDKRSMITKHPIYLDHFEADPDNLNQRFLLLVSQTLPMCYVHYNSSINYKTQCGMQRSTPPMHESPHTRKHRYP